METEGQGVSPIISFLPCYSFKISCSYLSFDVLPVISPLIWLIESSKINAAEKIRMTPLFSSLRYILYVCQMKCPDRCPAGSRRFYRPLISPAEKGEKRRPEICLRTAVHRLLICYPHKFSPKNLPYCAVSSVNQSSGLTNIKSRSRYVRLPW